LHGEVSREMFRPLWAGFDVTEVPIGSITNGVHGPTWTATETLELLGEITTGDDGSASDLASVSDRRLWDLRCLLRTRLVAEVRRRVRASWLQRGAAELELGWTDTMFDPDVLTIGFARRVPTYKRLTLMLRDPERLRRLLLDSRRPIQLVVAGKSHPADDPGKSMIQEFVRYADDMKVRHRIVFLPDYDMSMARYLYWGCDVWLNNPTRPMEACGTSGMKSALNGGLNLSIRDGWWDEMYDGDNGWAIPTADGLTDQNRRDELEANALYGLLDRQVVPAFYDYRRDGVPTRWLAMVRHTLGVLGPKVQASRMVREYVRNLYGPAAASAAVITADGYRGARELAAYRERLREHWTQVRVVDFELGSEDHSAPELGASIVAKAAVDHGDLNPADVEVQLVCGRVDGTGELYDLIVRPMTSLGGDTYEVAVALPHAGSVGYTVRVLPKHELLATPAELGRVVLAT
ncbi:MAG TPA: alpha-glucan family phosphorylase, partial [Pseudonocardiaceae bacterium]